MTRLMPLMVVLGASLASAQAGNTYDLAERAGQLYGLPPKIMTALVWQESRGNPYAISSAGAIGLAQLMPGTAKDLGVNPHDPWQNVLGGAKYLRQQWDRFGSWPLALAAYNAGPGNVIAYGGIPPFKETVNYVEKVLGMYFTLAPAPVQASRAQPAQVVRPAPISNQPTPAVAAPVPKAAPSPAVAASKPPPLRTGRLRRQPVQPRPRPTYCRVPPPQAGPCTLWRPLGPVSKAHALD